jgi:hypothetical protein
LSGRERSNFIITDWTAISISTLWNLRPPNKDKPFKAVIYRCDICDGMIPEAPDNFEAQMQMLDDIDNSFESELDRSTYESGPKLTLCNYCQKEYLIPSWI